MAAHTLHPAPDAFTATNGRAKRVIVFQQHLPHYRMGVFETIAHSGAFSYVFCIGRRDDPTAAGWTPVTFAARFAPMRQLPLPGVRVPIQFQMEEIRAALSKDFDVLIYSADLHVVSFVLGSILARLRGKKVIHWGHGISRGGVSRGVKWWLRRQVSNLANAVLLYGPREYDVFAQSGMDMARVFIAYNSLDTRRARALRDSLTPAALERFRDERGLRDHRLVIFAGRLQARKRVDLMVAAMHDVIRAIPAAKCVIIGDGPEMPRVRSQVEQLGLCDSVDLPGAIFDEEILARYFLCSELAVSPSHIGLMAHHAFTYGVPVLTTDNMSLHAPEVSMIQPGTTGMFFADGDVTALARSMIDLLSDPAKLRQMGGACRRLVDEVYNERVMAKVFDDAVQYALDH